jgi:PAS domain S-box-containing protein
MCAAPLHPNEPERLARLRGLRLLDSPPEALFDGFVRTAAAICEAPIAAVSLIDADRQWFKAQVGLGRLRETPRRDAFCAHTILDPGMTEVPDTRQDPRFADNPLVLHDPHIRFYAGVPLLLEGGWPVGTLCVADRLPRRLTDSQGRALRELAATLTAALTLREPAQWTAAERALLSSERHYRQLAESSPFGILFTDAQGRGLYSNDRMRELFGVDSHAAFLRHWRLAVHPDDTPRVVSAWEASKSSGRDFSETYRVRRADGSLRHLRANARPVRQHDGVITGWVGVVFDVTDSLRNEERLREQYLERERLRRHAEELRDLLQERSTMIDVLAHEVRQPLHSAAAALDAAGRALAFTHEGVASRDLGHARRVLAGVIAGVNNTLAASTALMTGDTAPVDTDIDMLVHITVADLLLADRGRVKLVRETRIHTVSVDVGLLRLALRNLLLNALRFSQAGTPVTIRLSDAEPPAVLNLDVIDEGRGIQSELIPHLFQRGRRGSDTVHGNGLGLYIARRAMELQGGRALVLSSGPGGTVMRLQLLDP